MSVDAIMLVRPKAPSSLRGVLDPETFTGTVLDDGSIMLHVFERFERLQRDVNEARDRLTQGLVDAHDDARGFLFFPDVCSPRGRSYDAVVAQVESAGIWVPVALLLQRASRRPLDRDAALGIIGVASERALWDGTRVIETEWAGDAETVIARLAMRKDAWAEEHHDERGVPVFRSPALAKVKRATSYADALERLGDSVTWYSARTDDERVEAERAKLRALLSR